MFAAVALVEAKFYLSLLASPNVNHMVTKVRSKVYFAPRPLAWGQAACRASWAMSLFPCALTTPMLSPMHVPTPRQGEMQLPQPSAAF